MLGLIGTSAASSSGRKIVCSPCRARKKRCNGERPVCSSCRDRMVPCQYPDSLMVNPTSSTSMADPVIVRPFTDTTATDQAIRQTLAVPPTDGFDDTFEFSHAFHDFASVMSTDKRPMISWNASQQQSNDAWQSDWPNGFLSEPFHLSTPLDQNFPHSTSTHVSSVVDTSAPEPHELLEFVDVYFRRVHHFLPILHRSTFQDNIHLAYTESHSRALALAVVSLSACERQDRSTVIARIRWYNEAKEHYASTGHLPGHPISTLQTAVFLIFQGMMLTDYHSAWLTLGKAWRQVVALGYHHLDSAHSKAMPDAPELPQDPIQRESIRRVIWSLYILDRGLCFPVGLVHIIEDKHLRVNLPMAEDDFQLSLQYDEAISIRFTSSFDRLLTTLHRDTTLTKRGNQLNYIILAYMLLGRIAAHHHSSEDSTSSERRSGFHDLESSLTNLRLCLPRSATSLSAAPPEHLKGIIWLNVVLDINTIFLYHGEIADSDARDFTYWHRCLVATRNTVAMIQEAAAISTDLLLNPQTASPLFCISRILIIECLVPTQPCEVNSAADVDHVVTPSDQGVTLRSSIAEMPLKDQTLKRDLELVMLVFERLAEAFGPIGTKFKRGMLYHLGQEAPAAALLKQNGINDIMSECASWGAPPAGFAATT